MIGGSAHVVVVSERLARRVCGDEVRSGVGRAGIWERAEADTPHSTRIPRGDRDRVLQGANSVIRRRSSSVSLDSMKDGRRAGSPGVDLPRWFLGKL